MDDKSQLFYIIISLLQNFPKTPHIFSCHFRVAVLFYFKSASRATNLDNFVKILVYLPVPRHIAVARVLPSVEPLEAVQQIKIVVRQLYGYSFYLKNH